MKSGHTGRCSEFDDTILHRVFESQDFELYIQSLPYEVWWKLMCRFRDSEAGNPCNFEFPSTTCTRSGRPISCICHSCIASKQVFSMNRTKANGVFGSSDCRDRAWDLRAGMQETIPPSAFDGQPPIERPSLSVMNAAEVSGNDQLAHAGRLVVYAFPRVTMHPMPVWRHHGVVDLVS